MRDILKRLDIRPAVYYEWLERAGEQRLEDRRPTPPRDSRLLAEETEAIVKYALDHPKEGYRRLTWMMVDEDVAHVSPTAVYETLKERDLLRRWPKSAPVVGSRPPIPTAPNQRWHLDVMYLWVVGRWYFLVTVLDAYSRFVVRWRLSTQVTGQEMSLVLQEALDRTPGATPEVVTDHGPEFVNRDFERVIRERALRGIRTRVHHPQSNGRVERYHRSVREEAVGDPAPQSYAGAVAQITEWVRFYNEERLHAGLGYLAPTVFYKGGDEAERRTTERVRKLAEARRSRIEINQTRNARA